MYLNDIMEQHPEDQWFTFNVSCTPKEIFETWLERGVDGIYLEGVQAIYEIDDLYLDEPITDLPGVTPVSHLYQTLK